MTPSFTMDWIKTTAQIGRLQVAAAAATAAAALALLPISGELHGDTLVYLALPLLVSGAYLHILPSYSKRAPPPPLAAAPLLLTPLFPLSPRLYLAAHSASMLASIAYAASRGSFTYQRALAASSYTSALLASLLPLPEPRLTALHALTAGMIYAVNSTALTHTYRSPPRAQAAYALAVLHAALPIAGLQGQAWRLAAAAELPLYLYMVRAERAPRWVSMARGFSGRARPVHLNLVYSSVLAIALYPLWLPLHGLTAVHAYAFGFLALNVAAHGPVLIPLALRVKPPTPSPALPALLAAAAVAKALVPLGMPRPIPCLLFAAGAALLALYSLTPWGRGS